MIPLEQYIIILLLTIFMELSIYLLLAYFDAIDKKIIRLFFCAVVINVLTNPLVNFVYHNIYDNVIVLESLVVISEMVMIFIFFKFLLIKINWPKALFISLVANLFSWLVGSPIAKIILDIL